MEGHRARGGWGCLDRLSAVCRNDAGRGIGHGDRIAQAIVAPVVQATYEVVEALGDSHRGDGVPPARSAGTHPAERVDPGAVDVAVRRGLRLAERPVGLVPGDLDDALVVTVCDAAHEELAAGAVTGSLEWSTLHWSVPDPVPVGADAFAAAADELERRIHRLRTVKDPA